MRYKKGCKKSYSNEHAFIPFGGDMMKCDLCGHIAKTKKTRVKKIFR